MDKEFLKVDGQHQNENNNTSPRKVREREIETLQKWCDCDHFVIVFVLAFNFVYVDDSVFVLTIWEYGNMGICDVIWEYGM